MILHSKTTLHQNVPIWRRFLKEGARWSGRPRTTGMQAPFPCLVWCIFCLLHLIWMSCENPGRKGKASKRAAGNKSDFNASLCKRIPTRNLKFPPSPAKSITQMGEITAGIEFNWKVNKSDCLMFMHCSSNVHTMFMQCYFTHASVAPWLIIQISRIFNQQLVWNMWREKVVVSTLSFAD